MLLQPKRTKYKKFKKSYLRNQLIETRKTSLKFGFFGLKILESTKMSAKQLEMFRQTLNRFLNRKGKIWIRLFPTIPVSSKPSEIRMGKGKGSVDHWIIPIKAGSLLFEIQGVSFQKAFFALNKIQKKMSLKSIVVKRNL